MENQDKKPKGNFMKFLTGMPGDEHGDGVMQDILLEMKPMFDKIAKPLIGPVFEMLREYLKGAKHSYPGIKKIAVLEVSEKDDVVTVMIFDKSKVKLDVAEKSCVLYKKIDNPAEFVESLMAMGGVNNETQGKELKQLGNGEKK